MNLNDSGLSGESQAQPFQQPPMASLPLGSAGSGGSGGGIWGVGPMPTAPPGPNPQTHDVWTGGQTSGSTTTYGPIYNPAAPPPSATYFNGAWGGVAPPPLAGSSHSGGSGSHRGGSNRLILAGVGPEVNQPRMEDLQVLWDQTKVALLETKALDQVNI